VAAHPTGTGTPLTNTAEELVSNRPEALPQIVLVAVRARAGAPGSEVDQERGPAVAGDSTPASDPEMLASTILEAIVPAMDLAEQEIGPAPVAWEEVDPAVAQV